MCVSVCYRASGYISGLYNHVCPKQADIQLISCRFLKICIVWTSMKTFSSVDRVLFACHDDQ